MRSMESIPDLIQEAKIRFIWWAICIFSITYFLAHTSKSMWMNVPIAVLIAVILRTVTNEVQFRQKVPPNSKQTYLSYMERKQLALNDYRLSSLRPQPKWKRKFDSPMVEAAAEDFIDKIIQDFVTDLWYSDITPDKEAPELIHATILYALGEIAGRVKDVNLVDLLTRDLVNLIGDHLELFRRTQASIGVDVMRTLSSEERDERLKHHLMASNELHPALLSAESEYKVLQRLVAGLLALVLRPKEAQCPLVRCIAREFVTCLVIQPLLNLVTPAYINELLEFILLQVQDFVSGQDGDDQSSKPDRDHPVAEGSAQSTVRGCKTSDNQLTDMPLAVKDVHREMGFGSSEGDLSSNAHHAELMHPKAGWARVLDAATQRRTEILAPENLENMWTIGRNYKDKINKSAKGQSLSGQDNKITVQFQPGSTHIAPIKAKITQDTENTSFSRVIDSSNSVDEASMLTPDGNKSSLKKSSSPSDLKIALEENRVSAGENKGLMISEDFYSPDLERHRGQHRSIDMSASVIRADGSHFPKLRCRVIGAYFEKIGSKSFAVYSIAVTDAHNKTWFVKRRYRNFERLHRHLKEIPNYNLHLPPKRIFSSSTEDAFVHQRCIQLDKYLQDLLAIANVAEQHQVWDFLSASSKNYSFGKSPSVMKTLAVNVDDAVDDIVRQFKGVSDGLVRKVSSSHYEPLESVGHRNLSMSERDMKMQSSVDSSIETATNLSDNAEGDKDEILHKGNGWHSDNELNSKSFPPRVVKQIGDTSRSYSENTRDLKTKVNLVGAASLPVMSYPIDDLVGVPPEWAPPNVSVPMLNLVDKVFQLNKRGWIRRQVFWISKQILQLVMEDAVDDWLLRQINWLRREEVVTQGILWVKDTAPAYITVVQVKEIHEIRVCTIIFEDYEFPHRLICGGILWPEGKFFLKLEITDSGVNDVDSVSFQATPRAGGSKSSQKHGSFETQLEEARRARFVKEMLFDGAPAPLVSLIGQKQYKRCARDIYYFLQSSVFLKQVVFSVLELILMSVFPELKDVVADIHQEQAHAG